MSSDTLTATEPQQHTGRRAAKSAKGTNPQQEPKPRKVSVYLTDDAIRRLDIHVAMEGGDRSRLIAHLIAENLRRYEMPRRRSGPTLTVTEDRPADAA